MEEEHSFSEEELIKQIGEARAKLSTSEETVEEAERRASSENIARMGRDRSWISISIIVTYALAILGALLYILVTSPDCAAVEMKNCSGEIARWESQVNRLQDLIVTAVLPIVTLMLGFYFGTETARTSAPKE